MALGQRWKARKVGSPLAPSRARRSSCTRAVSVGRSPLAKSGFRTPPTNAVSRTCPSGARPGKRRRREHHAEHVPTLDFRRQEAEPVQRSGPRPRDGSPAPAPRPAGGRCSTSVSSRSAPGKSRSISSRQCAGAAYTTASYSSARLERGARPSTPWGLCAAGSPARASRISAWSSRASASGSSCRPSRNEISAGRHRGLPRRPPACGRASCCRTP